MGLVRERSPASLPAPTSTAELHRQVNHFARRNNLFTRLNLKTPATQPDYFSTVDLAAKKPR
jgi:hypothetical protein